MKQTFLHILLISIGACCLSSAKAQVADSFLHENFDTDCVASTVPLSEKSSHWITYNPPASAATYPLGRWVCSPLGNHGTPGMTCTGYFNNTANIDTSFLITPLLDLRGFNTPHIYLQFDVKTSTFNPRARLSVLRSRNYDSLFEKPVYDTDVSAFIVPPLSAADSTGWVTHQIEITNLKSISPVYLSFRYTSDVTIASTWYLDNVSITTTGLGVVNITPGMLPVTVIGTSTRQQITLSFSASYGAGYHLSMYDMMGHEVYKDALIGQQGVGNYVLKGLHLSSGLYCIKIEGDNNYDVVKVMIP